MIKFLATASIALSGTALADNQWRKNTDVTTDLNIPAFSVGLSEVPSEEVEPQDPEPVPITLNNLSNVRLDFGSEVSCRNGNTTNRLIEHSSNQYGSWCQSSQVAFPATGWNYFEYLSHISSVCSYSGIVLSTTSAYGYNGGNRTGSLPNVELRIDNRYEKVVSNSGTIDFSDCGRKDIVYGVLQDTATGDIYLSKNGNFSYFGNDPITRSNPVGKVSYGTPLHVGIITYTNSRKVDVELRLNGFSYAPSGVMTEPQ